MQFRHLYSIKDMTEHIECFFMNAVKTNVNSVRRAANWTNRHVAGQSIETHTRATYILNKHTKTRCSFWNQSASHIHLYVHASSHPHKK